MAGNQPQYMMDMIRMYRDTINRSFFVDQIIRQEKKERQSVTEIQDTRGQMLNQLAPLINRMESEYIGPEMRLSRCRAWSWRLRTQVQQRRLSTQHDFLI
jgi:hypothetical protein